MMMLAILRFRAPERTRWLEAAAAVLRAEELEHLTAITDRDTRVAHAVGRAMMRLIGAQLSGRNPRGLEIALSEEGKPWFPDLPALQISLSHACRTVLVASHTREPIGVDIESVARIATDPRRLAERLFAPVEAESVRGMPDAGVADWFASVWTVKEAVGKALGCGIIPALSGVVTERSDGGIRLAEVSVGPPADGWTLYQPTAGGGREKIAVAVPAPDAGFGRVSELTLADFRSALRR